MKLQSFGYLALAFALATGTAAAPGAVQADTVRTQPISINTYDWLGTGSRRSTAAPKVVRVSAAAMTFRSRRATINSYDWLRKVRSPAAGTVARVSVRRTIGNGSWICSPAGFGEKSRCHSN